MTRHPFIATFPQLFYILHRRRTKEPLVFARDVRRIAIPHAVPGTGRIQTLAEHQPAGFLQPQLLLELQRAQRRDFSEVVVEARHAHPQRTRKLLDAHRLVEVVPEPINGLGNAVGDAPKDGYLYCFASSALRSFLSSYTCGAPRTRRHEHRGGGIWKRSGKPIVPCCAG